MTEIPGVDDTVQAVWDGFYSQSRIFAIDVSRNLRSSPSADPHRGRRQL